MKKSLMIVSCAALIPSATLFAQDYEIISHTIDGGGSSNAVAGAFTLSGSIGQPDAGVPMTAGSYELRGGFWPTVANAQPCEADFADPPGVLDIFDVFAYLGLFNAGDLDADFAEPFGILDIFDVFAFLEAFNQGCP